MKKVCAKCKKKLPITFFQLDRQQKCGYKPYCKDCSNLLSREYYNKNKSKVAKRVTDYREKNEEIVKLRRKKYYEKNKERIFEVARLRRKKMRLNKLWMQKKSARSMVYWAVKNGKLKKGCCIICGDKKAEAHHHRGYTKRYYLDVIWLCRKHHAKQDN